MVVFIEIVLEILVHVFLEIIFRGILVGIYIFIKTVFVSMKKIIKDLFRLLLRKEKVSKNK